MSENANIELARRLLAAFETGDVSVVDELIHPAHRDHARFDRSPGPDGVRDSIRWMRETFAQRRIVLEDVIASGDRIVARVRFTATLGADGAAGDGRLETEHVHIWRVAYGRLAEHWMVPGELIAPTAVTSD
jgi:ketosteroid isomerase-like protein